MSMINSINFLLPRKNKINFKEINKFMTKGMNLVEEHMSKTEYYTQQTLMREINYLIFYTFEILKDDFFNGDKVLEESITQLDDYVFSQYKNKKALEKNLQYLTIIACSNRFKSNPHENLLAYYVFLEENGFEIIQLYKDFYQLMKENTTMNDAQHHKKIDLIQEKYEYKISPTYVQHQIEKHAPSMIKRKINNLVDKNKK